MTVRPVCTILLLDDEPLILMDLEFAAQDEGCRSLCATTAGQALSFLAGAERIDVAVLDVTLQNGETCLPVARELQRLRIPYLLHSGDLDRRYQTVRELDSELIAKPACSSRVIRRAMSYVGQRPDMRITGVD
ncbi:MAG: response regulator [Novosphingobium sp.]|jgi:DNA-binding response OmpR family regulator|uniref:response regulator n=1 Tax=Tsuneonella sp. CC-YZS046 TaxID=3042152 RepID=UPI002D773EEF|nr:response regulator [Tsuneonella sp. CC-YZS046]WRO67148.1 response regulator [Tsuneonella sp. CC-YZS046]